MTPSAQEKTERIRRSLWLLGLVIVGVSALEPIYFAGYNMVAVCAAAACLYALPQLTAMLLRKLAELADHAAAKISTTMKGSAAFATSISELKGRLLKPGLFRTGHGSYWGCFKPRGLFGLFRQPIMLDLPAISVCLGKTGSGKDVLSLQINILSIPGSKFIVDYDGTTTAIVAAALRKKGETVHILNLDDKYADIIGTSGCMNPLDHIVDCFEIGCITDVFSDVTEIAFKLLPETQEGLSNANEFFTDGSRDLIIAALIFTILLHGRRAILSDALSLLRRKDELLHLCLWFSGGLQNDAGETDQADLFSLPWAGRHDARDIQNFADVIADMAKEIVDLISNNDEKTFQSFRIGAVQKLKSFNKATRASKKLSRSTFQFSELQNPGEDVTIFLVMDSAKQDAQSDLVSLILAIAKKEWVRHPNAGKKSVTVFLNEFANYRFPGSLHEFISWSRKFGLRLMFLGQNTSNIDRQYGDGTTEALISEADIFLCLPGGLSEPKLLDIIEKRLGNVTYMNKGNSGQREAERGVDGYSYSEDSRPLMTTDEIRRNDKFGILFVGAARPVRSYFSSIAGTWPHRHLQSTNPLYGAPYRERVTLRLLRYAPWFPANVMTQWKVRRKQSKTMEQSSDS